MSDLPPTSPGKGSTTSTGVGDHEAFAHTHWSVVLRAGKGDSTCAHDALARLCRIYWRPLYAYVRRRGYSPHDAEDLTQAFFAAFLERRAIAKAHPHRGRFRSFLLTSFKNFLSDEWDKRNAAKRGGGRIVLSVDYATEEGHLQPEAADVLTPDKLYERRWALALLEQVYQQLEADARRQGKWRQFSVLRTALTAPRGSVPYARLAEQTGMSPGAIKVAVHRLRRQYREILKSTIADTVSGPEEVEDELRHLLEVLTE